MNGVLSDMIGEERTHELSVFGRTSRLVERPGAPGRVPLLLCNGIGSGLELFDPFVRRLDPDRPIIRFDVPGVGESEPPLIPYRFSTLALTLSRAVRRLGYARTDVLGISWGGALAQQFAFQHPRFCRRLVLAATSAGWTMIPARPDVLARMMTPRRHRDQSYAIRVAGDVYGGSARKSPAKVIEMLHATDRPPTIRGYLYQLAAITGWSSLPALPLIRQPTLLLAERDDPIIPLVNPVLMARLLPNATLHQHDGGHLALLTESADLAPVVDEFLHKPNQ